MERTDKLLLHRVSARGDLGKVKELVSAGWKIDCRDGDGATLLFAAALKGQVEVVKFLISGGAAVNQGNDVRYTPLMTAAREKHPEVVRILLKAKADPELVSESGMQVMHWALLNTIPMNSRHFESETKLIEILSLLKEHGSDLNAKGKNGETPLMDAAWWGLGETSKFLLSHGAKRDDKDNDGQTAMDYARKRIAKNLGADVNENCQRVMEILAGPQKQWWKFWH